MGGWCALVQNFLRLNGLTIYSESGLELVLLKEDFIHRFLNG